MSAESWPKLFFDVSKSDIHISVISGYFWTWIILGKYILLNLFLAMVIDGFSSKEIKHKIDVIEDNEEDNDQVLDNYTKTNNTLLPLNTTNTTITKSL